MVKCLQKLVSKRATLINGIKIRTAERTGQGEIIKHYDILVKMFTIILVLHSAYNALFKINPLSGPERN